MNGFDVLAIVIIGLMIRVAYWLINMPRRYVIKTVGPHPVIEEF